MGETTVLLVRHGETAWNREGRIQGWAPTALTDRGREQARRLGVSLTTEYEIDSVVASDLTRTRETAALGSAVSVPHRRPTAPGANGIWGFTREQLHERFPAFAVASGVIALEEPPERGESFVALYSRIRTTWESLVAEAADETVLVVTHGGPITAILAMVKELYLITAVRLHSIGNCALTAVDAVAGEILRENEQPFDPVS